LFFDATISGELKIVITGNNNLIPQLLRIIIIVREPTGEAQSTGTGITWEEAEVAALNRLE